MIKPVTYQGVFNFKANLYALEVKSRFIDQSKANGFYRGYGEELAAKIIGQTIQIGTGAFVVQGRMNEVTAAETVTPQIFDGFVGYVIARIETYHPSDEENCTFEAVVNRTFDAISLRQDDIYAADSENTNKVYELPIYSFAISGSTITNLQKLIGAVDDYAKINEIVTSALSTAQAAVSTANGAVSTAQNALNAANDAVLTSEAANGKSDNAVNAANGAVSTASAADSKATEALAIANNLDDKIDSANATAQAAEETANNAASIVQEQHEEMSAEIAELEKAIVEGQGTVVERDGAMLAKYNVDNVIETTDTLTIEGGGV